jgi:hypothetical protein
MTEEGKKKAELGIQIPDLKSQISDLRFREFDGLGQWDR